MPLVRVAALLVAGEISAVAVTGTDSAQQSCFDK